MRYTLVVKMSFSLITEIAGTVLARGLCGKLKKKEEKKVIYLALEQKKRNYSNEAEEIKADLD